MKARNYREVKGAPYTKKKFIHGAPPPKITKFTLGKASDNYRYQLSLVANKRVQIRHNALEASRIAVNRYLQAKLGENFFMRVLVLPHVVLRENKMIFGAHADRLQDGMRASFGRPIGTAARVEPGQPVIMAQVPEGGVEIAKEALKRGEAKLPTTCRVVVEELANQTQGEKTVVN